MTGQYNEFVPSAKIQSKWQFMIIHLFILWLSTRAIATFEKIIVAFLIFRFTWINWFEEKWDADPSSGVRKRKNLGEGLWGKPSSKTDTVTSLGRGPVVESPPLKLRTLEKLQSLPVFLWIKYCITYSF